jgi:hypothetical protein
LRGDEIRACWELAGTGAEAAADARLAGPPSGTSVRKLDFVEVPSSRPASQPGTAAAPPNTADRTAGIVGSIPPNPAAVEPRWSLWGDPEV